METEKMSKKKLFLIAVSLLVLVPFIFAIAFAQSTPAGKNMEKATLKGKIGHRDNFGYYIIGENPRAEIFIVNQDKKVLEKLKAKGKQVTIEGHYTIGADHLMIEKINGKKYPR
jgi:hypothetical protein